MGLDDYSMIACQFAFSTYAILQIVGPIHGIGQHMQDLSMDNAQLGVKVRQTP